MKISTSSKHIFIHGLLLFSGINLYAQEGNLTVTQDPKFEQLLNEKRKINPSITVNDRYKIRFTVAIVRLQKALSNLERK